MLAEDLRKAVLQAAIQGKLVSQDKNDEPVSVLLERLREKRAQFLKGKKIKKGKDLAPISNDELPFDIPESWRWMRFGSVVFISTNLVEPNQYLDMLHIAPDNIQKYTGRLLECKTVKEDNVISKNHLFHKGQLIYSKIRPELRKIVIAPFDGLCSADMYPLETDLDTLYVKWFILTDYFSSIVNGKANRVKMPKINQEELNEIIIPIPPINEQHRIVAKVDELMARIDEFEKVEHELKSINKAFPIYMKKSLLKAAIQGKLTKQLLSDGSVDELLEKIEKQKMQLVKEKKIKNKKSLASISANEIPFEIPDNWRWVRLGDLAEYKKGPFGSSLTKSMFVKPSYTTVKVYEQKNAIGKDWCLGDYYITREKYESMQGFKTVPGDIIVSCAGTIGETYILPQDAPVGIINQALMRIRLHWCNISEYYLLYFDYIVNIASKLGGKGSAIKNIPPLEELKNILMPLPPLEEQDRIVQSIKKLSDLIDLIEFD